MKNLSNIEVYLERMAKPLQEKLKIIKYFPDNSETIVDVGCADGSITIEMAKLFPEIKFLGIDLSDEFIKIAQKRASGIRNVKFEKIYLRQLLARPEKYDTVVFCSVLHEFYSYGEGISSVLKALADGHELLVDGGFIIARDMILNEYTKKSVLYSKKILEKILKNARYLSEVEDFERHFGRINNVYKINHFLLKYLYTENWSREVREHYVPVTFEEYERIIELLGMTLQYKESYLIPFLKDLWQKDFSLSDDETSILKSTGIIAAEKTSP